MRKKFENRGFMDQLYWYNLRAVWIFTWACFWLNAISGYLQISDLAVITYGIPAAWTELGVHTGFMIWKAKSENSRKFRFGTNGQTNEDFEEVAISQEREDENYDIYELGN
ncbi:MAG: hypothetical protein J6B68_03925 [Lachnospiraceae bacterium]|nr:hypothetical protein [Lachnospiraceae bacterium]